jgi:hypothetical protein
VTGIAVLINFDNMDDLLQLAEGIDTPSEIATPSTPWIKYSIFGLIGMGFLGFMYLYSKKPKFKKKFLGFVNGFIDGIKTIFTMKDRWGYLFHTLIIWTCYVLMFRITFYAWDETSHMTADGILSAFIAGTIGFIIVQGGIGTYPIMVGAVLTFFLAQQGYPATPERVSSHIGFGALVWATQTLLIVFLGLISLGMVQVNKKKKAKLN